MSAILTAVILYLSPNGQELYCDAVVHCDNGQCHAHPIEREYNIDCSPDDVECWDVGSEGWISPVVCKQCKLSIPVVVDGE